MYCRGAIDSTSTTRFHTIVCLIASTFVCLQLLGKKVRVLLEWKREKGVVLPELGAEVSVGRAKGVKDGLDKVPHGTGVTSTGGVAIGDTGHAHELLSGGGGNESGTARGRDQTNGHGTALSGDLAGNRVGKSGRTSPVSSSDGNDIELGGSDGSTNGRGDFRRALDSEADVSGGISNGHKGLEAGALTGGRLLLDGHDLHDLVLELVLQKVIDDLGFLDGDGEEEDLLDAGDLSFLDQAAELGDGDPDVFVTASASSAASSSSTSAASSAASSASSAAESSSASFLLGWCVVTHLDMAITITITITFKQQ